jgi:nickel-dependent lactate racemase
VVFITTVDGGFFRHIQIRQRGAIMQVDLWCGEREVGIKLPDDTIVLNPNHISGIEDSNAAVWEALKAPIGTAPLKTLAKGRKDACIVISDVTRPVPNKIILPPILQTLAEAGIEQSNITILIATGMHRPNLGEELEGMVGREIMDNYRIVNHFCQEASQLRQIAEIDGAPIELNTHYLDADLKILTGLIEPHMYAGYSGGRKSILPGISSYKTMTHMHSFKMIDHPNVTNCKLRDNPFHEAGEQVAELAGVDFILNVVINKSRDLVAVVGGHHAMAHQAGCRQVEQMSVRDLAEPVDLMITSAGGYPLDATFYQVSKGLIAAKNVLKPGGAVIIACECREGLGSEAYCEMIRKGDSPGDFFDHYCQPNNFIIDQWCLQTTYQALAHAAKIYVYSPYLEEKDLDALGMTKIEDIQTAVDLLLPNYPQVAASPEGPYVVGRIGVGAAARAQTRPSTPPAVTPQLPASG